VIDDDGPESLGQGEILCESASGKAWKIRLDELGQVEWIPKSVIHDDSEAFDDDDNACGEVVVKSWFARKNGLA